MSLTPDQHARMLALTEEYAQALAAMRRAERELAQKRAAYLDFIQGLGMETAHLEGVLKP